jgi:endonuclease/exonuclease/phosphatase family metal-dependent hydrolase
MAALDLTFRVATWNIHGCVGIDRLFDPERCVSIIESFDADILAVQEVNSRISRRRGLDTFGLLRARTRCEAVEARMIVRDEDHYGHMLLSRWPILDGRVHDLSTRKREPRKAIEAMIKTPCGTLRVLAVHLGWRVLEQRKQVAMVRRIIDEGRPQPTIMLGDFNEPHRSASAHRTFADGFEAAPPWPTFPTRRPFMPLDRIWCSPPLRMQRAWVHEEAGKASDHLPLLANIRCTAAWQQDAPLASEPAAAHPAR